MISPLSVAGVVCTAGGAGMWLWALGKRARLAVVAVPLTFLLVAGVVLCSLGLAWAL